MLQNLFFFFDLVSYNVGDQGLQDKIKLVILDRENRPAWYKEKINSADKVKYINANLLQFLGCHMKMYSSICLP